MTGILEESFIRDAYIYDVYDGDTVYYHANLGYGTWAAFQTGRLLNIDTPEIRPLVTREAATEAKDHLKRLLRQYALNIGDTESLRAGYKFRLQSIPCSNKWVRSIPQPQKGKYGRWLVTIWGATSTGDAVNLNKLMIADGFAQPASY